MASPLSKIRNIDNTYYLAGELGFEAEGQLAEGIEAQTRVTLERISRTLEGVGLTLGDVVTATCYLTDPADFQAFNAVCAGFFPDPKPSRTTIGCALMAPDAKVEITVIAQGK